MIDFYKISIWMDDRLHPDAYKSIFLVGDNIRISATLYGYEYTTVISIADISKLNVSYDKVIKEMISNIDDELMKVINK
ncbi:hypothetical protein 65p030 [Aeromonas phage 65]|uniref:Uncharacterized protein n=2 Tax=Ishigurovirus osborne TaxID=260149 RepID=A0A219YBP6_9CAUD|nr:hypothetical protein ST65p030 [Aeromonas phage 65]AAR90908.1 hypothetical protein 65p030 [Aeromonas phage 65]APU01421.1 hypothetical protein [Aeromonas phage 65.2]